MTLDELRAIVAANRASAEAVPRGFRCEVGNCAGAVVASGWPLPGMAAHVHLCRAHLDELKADCGRERAPPGPHCARCNKRLPPRYTTHTMGVTETIRVESFDHVPRPPKLVYGSARAAPDGDGVLYDKVVDVVVARTFDGAYGRDSYFADHFCGPVCASYFGLDVAKRSIQWNAATKKWERRP